MDFNSYIEPSKRKKILLLSDDLRLPSGVGCISKEIVCGTAQHFNWVQIGAAINHPDAGKFLDISAEVNREWGYKDACVRIIPSNGYGDPVMLRQILRQEKPDALMMFTDPRYWIWLFQMEREIRQHIPIIYLNIWDDLPYPVYNRPFYQACDGLFAISKQTLNINKVVLGEDGCKGKVIRYLPHGVSSKFTNLSKDDSNLALFKKQLFGSETPDFTLLYNARNIGRKRVTDIILAWRFFIDIARSEKGFDPKKVKLLLHTDPVDNSGTDLPTCINSLIPEELRSTIGIVSARLSTEDMNLLYNSSDGVILASSNEGWGLSLTEALLTGRMFIAPVTGGMQDQMRFENEDGSWIDFTKDFPSNHTYLVKDHGKWCIPVPITSRACCGSPVTPYIYDDRCTIEDLGKAIHKLFILSPEERKACGKAGEEWARGEEAGFTSEIMCDRFAKYVDRVFETFKPRERYELIKVTEAPSTYVDYDPITYSR